MVIGIFIPCYIEAVFQEAGIAAVCPRCRLPARPGLLRPADGHELEYAIDLPFHSLASSPRCEELFWMGTVSVRTRGPSAPRTRLKFILREEPFGPEP
jgi:hypothetical protein